MSRVSRRFRSIWAGVGAGTAARTGTALLGVLGDPHANDVLTASALAHLRRLGCTTIVCTGDVVDGLGDPARTIDLLQAHDVVVVRGNHDRWLAEGTPRAWDGHATGPGVLGAARLAWLRNLPAQRVLETPVGDLLLCHGLAGDDMNRLRVDDFGYALEANEELAHVLAGPRRPALVVKGHTHRPGVGRPGGLLVVDAGTLRADHQPSVCALDFDAGVYRRWAAVGQDWKPVQELALPDMRRARQEDGAQRTG